MKTKALFLTFILIATFSFGVFAQMSKTSSIDVENSSIVWTGKKVTGAHEGKISLKQGKLEFLGNELAGGSFEIDMNSITVDDIQDETSNAKLVKHLKTADFFNTTIFKSANMVINTVDKVKEEVGTGKAKSIVNYNVVGSFTIKDITQKISFPVTVSYFGEAGVRAEAKITIDRTAFDIHYGADKSLGDRMIYNDFELVITLSAK